ncbi:TolC family protein [Fodinibius sediminis]|uniref:Outer membrane protein TolC n=1 Tax=Fodinibius sediminis TaxID=1214077 RepID=A0A521E1J6_9BACT|nr:TolC family protein [Fodinibius sediminis]SMO77181.1 Outer membrane protein TolC [Fodinibius sediminis]
MNSLAVLLIALFPVAGPAETDSISLNYCYQRAYEDYPTARNIELQEEITRLNVAIAHTAYFPDVSINGRMSYQSEVAEIAVGGGGASVSKDQYEASLDVTQTIFNGGVTGIRKDLQRARGRQQVEATKIELHQIRSQIDQVYFGILLSQQQARTIRLLIQNLEKQLAMVRSQVDNGVLLPSQQYILKAELIKARQDSVENRSNITAGYRVLSDLIGEEVPEETGLVLPAVPADYRSLQSQRAEYALFSSRKETLEQQLRLAKTAKVPAVSAFGTAAYGRPGYNFLNDDFHSYYIAGFRIRWNIRDVLNMGREQQALQIEQQKIEQEEQAFTRQVNASLDRLEERIFAIKENMKRDREIINLRSRVVDESGSQLKNGVITATEYVTELNEANRARLSLFINKVRLAQAQNDYLTTLGIPIQE